MAKAGQGFSKIYTKSQYEGSYYNGPSLGGGAAHTSAADLNDGLSGVDMAGDRNSRMNKLRGSST